MPNYHTKYQEPMTEEEFSSGLEQGHFVQENHKGFCVLLYYSAVRKREALRARKEQFRITPSRVLFSVGKRLKHGIETPELSMTRAAPHMEELVRAIESTEQGKRVFPYCDATGYNIVARVFKYPHYFRLSRITNFFSNGWTIAQVHSWTGLTLKALDYYLGIVDVHKMGDSLR